jgi:hypothetical protein
MALFKSDKQRQIERSIRLRQALREIERNIRQQDKYAEDFIRNARHAKEIGDNSQYAFIRNALKKTAVMKKLLERQVLSMKNAMLIKKQAEANALFARSMGEMARDIGKLFEKTDVTRTETQWAEAMAKAESMEERMELFLDSVEGMAADSVAGEAIVSDQEIDRMIEADMVAEKKKELDELDSLTSEIDRELGKEEA